MCNSCGARKLVDKFHPNLYSTTDGILAPLARTFGAQAMLCGAYTERAVRLCQQCHKALQAHKLPKYAIANNLEFGDIPQVLKDLTAIELRLIGRVDPFVTVHRLAGGQYGTKDNIVNFYNDVTSVLQKLPRSIDNISTIFVRLAGSSTRQHVIRPNKIREALHWLKSNNQLYHDIIIDEEVLATLEERQPAEIVLDAVPQVCLYFTSIDYLHIKRTKPILLAVIQAIVIVSILMMVLLLLNRKH